MKIKDPHTGILLICALAALIVLSLTAPESKADEPDVHSMIVEYCDSEVQGVLPLELEVIGWVSINEYSVEFKHAVEQNLYYQCVMVQYWMLERAGRLYL